MLPVPKFMSRANARRSANQAARALALSRWLTFRAPARAATVAPATDSISMGTLRAIAQSMAEQGVETITLGGFGRVYQASLPHATWTALSASPDATAALFAGEIAVSPEPWCSAPTAHPPGPGTVYILLRAPVLP